MKDVLLFVDFYYTSYYFIFICLGRKLHGAIGSGREPNIRDQSIR